MLLARQNTQIRTSLLQRIVEARKQTDKLFEIVRPDALYNRPIPERHRIVFYIGHLEAFDWNLLRPSLPGVKVFDAALDRLFAFGIDPVDGQLPSDQPSDWPDISVVQGYVARIRESLDNALDREIVSEQLLHVAIEHRLMHAETLAYMLHQLPLQQKRSEPQAKVPETETPDFQMLRIPAGCVTLGLSRDDPTQFGWDNEYDARPVHVPAFEIDRYKVTNGQYLEFVNAGGYDNRRYWTDADWDWKFKSSVEHPAFWKPIASGKDWLYRGFFEEMPLPASWPVYVSFAEASAYSSWAGKRLPSEAEWQRAATGLHDGVENSFPWGDEQPTTIHGYFDFARWDPFPVNAFPENRSPFGVEGLLANGWEWTASPFAPFAGFQHFPFYEGYSANFFDGLHYVMKGGSQRTERCMLRRSFRNWFQPHYQYVYAGFRCAASR